jgi:cytochrome c556
MYKLRPLLASAFLLVVAGAQAADPVEEAVEYRQAVMNVYYWNLNAMGNMAKGKLPFDAATFARHAKDLAAATQLELMAAFPEDSVNDESDASDTIWLDWQKFQDKHKALREEAAKLAEVAAGGDEESIKKEFGATGKTCKGCHDDFKK